MDINDICRGIRELKTREELKLVSVELRASWNALGRLDALRASAQFGRGDAVEWASSKFGRLIRGTVVRFGPKNVVVRSEDGTQWRVHPSFLRKPVEA
jgi:hypothetical protein